MKFFRTWSTTAVFSPAIEAGDFPEVEELGRNPNARPLPGGLHFSLLYSSRLHRDGGSGGGSAHGFRIGPISFPGPSFPALSTPALSTPALSTPALSTPALSTPVLSTPVLSTPAISTRIRGRRVWPIQERRRNYPDGLGIICGAISRVMDATAICGMRLPLEGRGFFQRSF